MASGTKAWDRYSLGTKDIFYDEVVPLIPIGGVPQHVQSLRLSMLDFNCPILGFDEGIGAHRLDQLQTSGGAPDEDYDLFRAKKTFHKAAAIFQGGYLEKTWEAFFQTHFFEPLVDSVSVAREDPRRVSRCYYYYDGIRRETNELWNLFDRSSPTPGLESFECLKCPKPDQAFYLPIYHPMVQPAIPTIIDPEARRWDRTPTYALTEPFSWSTLKELHASGLYPTPFNIFSSPPNAANLKSFPWLIVEHKKENTGTEQVYCQAANAGACAIRLNVITARHALELPEDAHVPPIPTVTTVGPLVKVWIVYYARNFDAPSSRKYVFGVTTKKRKEGYVMKAIWEGDMTKLSDIIKFQVILENTHTWAMRVFKPLMASYLTQWKAINTKAGNYTGESAKLRRQETVDRCQTVLPIVQTLLDRHSTMELDDRENVKVTPLLLGLLVQQICTSEREFLSSEVDRVVMEKLQTLDLSSGTPMPDGEAGHRGSNVTQIVIESETEEEIQISANQHEADRASQSRGQSILGTQSSVMSPSPTVDNDDPKDGDYQQSQATTAAEPSDDEADSVAESSGAASSVAEFSDTDTLVWRSPGYTPRRPSITPRARSSRDQVNPRSRQSTPRSASTVTRSGSSTPRANSSKNRISANFRGGETGSPEERRSTRSDPQQSSSIRSPFASPPAFGNATHAPKTNLQQTRQSGDNIDGSWLRKSPLSNSEADRGALPRSDSSYFSIPDRSSPDKSMLESSRSGLASLSPRSPSHPRGRSSPPAGMSAPQNLSGRDVAQSEADMEGSEGNKSCIDLTRDSEEEP